jgi:hypothetical protein
MNNQRVAIPDPGVFEDGLDGTGLEELDSILAGDPLDMFQWDEWESLTSEFFAG